MVEHLPYKQTVTGSSPVAPTIFIFTQKQLNKKTAIGKDLCGNSSVVEYCLAKAGVASSNLVSRSKRAVFLFKKIVSPLALFLRHHSQVVRRESAKLWFPSSNLGGASKFADVAEQADARDLKSLGGKLPYRFKSDHQHQTRQIRTRVFGLFFFISQECLHFARH